MLEMNVVMRSNDVWLGTPYDWFQFTQLQYTVANALRIPAGPYHHTAWSLHIYEEHIEAAQRLRQPPDEDYTRGTSPTGIGCWGESLQTIQDQARRLADHRVVVLQQRVNESEWWYHQQLKAAFLNRKIIDE
jgi:thymidylate synthase